MVMSFRLGAVLLTVLVFGAIAMAQARHSKCETAGTAVERREPSLIRWSSTFPTRAGSNSPAVSSMRPIRSPRSIREERFHWGKALRESFIFLTIEQAYVVHEDYRWVTIENGVPFNHYWRDYKQSLHTWIDSGWNDGDDPLYNYVGHPIQGATTSFIQIQNDPQGSRLEFSNTKAYWWSRFKATIWNAAYSTQWSIGPLSELTVEKYGTKARSPWNHDGTWPCHERNCYTGTGQVNLVITPLGGLGWLLAEDILDRYVARRVEGATTNHFWVDLVRCATNPIRGGANILHGKRPWYRPSRDVPSGYFLSK
jgi:hypothetical protein